jgi:hypothetical protein
MADIQGSGIVIQTQQALKARGGCLMQDVKVVRGKEGMFLSD